MKPGHQTATTDAIAIPRSRAREIGRPVSRHSMRLRQRRRSRHRWLTGLGVVLVLLLMVRGFVVQPFYIPSGSMQPTLEPDDRLLVNKVDVASSLRRGDVVVFDGTGSFAGHPVGFSEQSSLMDKGLGAVASMFSIQANRTDFVKRVVGLPRDHVVCCDAKGLLTVNGVAVKESYLYPGDKPSDLTFDITVPAQRIWVMGDHRSESADSRAHLGDPGGGMVPIDDVIGRVAMVYWPPGRAGVPKASDSLEKIPVGTAGERHK